MAGGQCRVHVCNGIPERLPCWRLQNDVYKFSASYVANDPNNVCPSFSANSINRRTQTPQRITFVGHSKCACCSAASSLLNIFFPRRASHNLDCACNMLQKQPYKNTSAFTEPKRTITDVSKCHHWTLSRFSSVESRPWSVVSYAVLILSRFVTLHNMLIPITPSRRR